ncbi:unnamed protein product [Absidia cylindrospora]
MPDAYQHYEDEYDVDTTNFDESQEHDGITNTGSPMNIIAASYSQLFAIDDHSNSDDNQHLLRINNSMDTGITSRHIDPSHPRTHWYSDIDTGDYLLDHHSQEVEEEELDLDTDDIGNDDDDDDAYGEHLEQNSGEHMEMDSGDNGDWSMDDNEKETNALDIYHSTHPDIDQKDQGGREIAEHEAIWAVSTYRPDWGVEKMRDNNPLTYWQSDCQNPRSPHTVDIYFRQATFIKQISIFYDFYQDESYSPKEISIRGGTTYRDLHEIAKITCEESVRWQNVDLSSLLKEPLRVFQLQIAILSTYMNGKDVHIRQIKVYSLPLPYLQETSETDGELKIHPIKYKGLR